MTQDVGVDEKAADSKVISRSLPVIEPPSAPDATCSNPDSSSTVGDENDKEGRPLQTTRKKQSDLAHLTLPQVENTVQGALMASKVVSGETIESVAKQFNVSSSTVSARLRSAHTEEIIKRASELVADRLLPLALATYDKHLKKGDLRAAKDVLFGIGVLQQKVTKEVTKRGNANILDQIRQESAIDGEILDKHPSDDRGD